MKGTVSELGLNHWNNKQLRALPGCSVMRRALLRPQLDYYVSLCYLRKTLQAFVSLKIDSRFSKTSRREYEECDYQQPRGRRKSAL